MNKPVSAVLALSLLAGGPALAQNAFGQMPNPGGFASPGAGGMPQPMQQPMSPTQPAPTQPAPQYQQPQTDQSDMMVQRLQQMAPIELQDFGVPPTQQLHDGAMHGPTPNSIPGARVVTTVDLYQLVMSGQPYLLFDVLGNSHTLPGAIMAVNAAQPGSFQDQTQQGFGQFLQQVTNGQPDLPLIFYCASSQCWMSYNAALRAANLGYRNVLWYRGGLEAWGYAGLPTMPAGGGMMPNPGGGMGGGGMMPNPGGGGMGGGGMMPNPGGGGMGGGGAMPNPGGGGMGGMAPNWGGMGGGGMAPNMGN